MAKETMRNKIIRLEQEIALWKQRYDTMLADYHRIEQEKSELLDTQNDTFIKSPYFQQLNSEIERLKARNSILEQENQRLRKNKDELIRENNNLNDLMKQRPKPVHNARHAGRKPGDAKQQAQYQHFKSLVESGKDMDEIMSQMKISRATYYRYKSSIKN